MFGDSQFEIVRLANGLTLEEHRLPESCAIGAAVARKAGECLLASREGVLWQYSAAGWKEVGQLGLRDVTAGCAIDDGRMLFGSAQGELELIDGETLARMHRQRVHADAVQDIVSLDESTVASVSRDCSLRVWEIGRELVMRWSINDLHAHFINCAALIGDHLWTGSSDGEIAVTSISKRRVVHRKERHRDSVRVLDRSPDNSRVLSVADDGAYKIFEARSFKEQASFGNERQYIRGADVFLGSTQSLVAFGSTAGVVQYGSLGQSDFGRRKLTEKTIRAVRFIDERRIAVGDEAGRLIVFDLTEGRVVAKRETEEGLFSIRVSRVDDLLVCGYRDGAVRSFSLSGLSRGLLTKPSLGDGGWWFGFVFGKRAKREGGVLPQVATRKIHTSIVGDLLLLGSGHLLSCSDDQTICTSLLRGLEPIRTTSFGATAVNNLIALDPFLIATSDSGAVFVADLISQNVVRRYEAHDAPVRAIARLTSELVATGDRSGGVKLWNPSTLETIGANRFRERVIDLRFDSTKDQLHVVTESEVASLQLDAGHFHARTGMPATDTSGGPSLSSTKSKPIDVFISYSHRDEPFRERLDKHLSLLKREGLVRNWVDRQIEVGADFDKVIRKQLSDAEVIILLVSPDFMSSDYCYDVEMKFAMERHEQQSARVLPVILRPTDWRSSPFGGLLALPTDGRPVVSWPNEDDAFLEVASALRKLVARGR